MHLDDEEKTLSELAELGFELQPLALDGSLNGGGASVTFHGHFLLPKTDPVTGDDVSVQLPTDVAGKLSEVQGPQTFFRTDTVLEMGMCGGPCIAGHGEHSCVGMTEGIVPPEGGHPLAGQAAVILAETLHKLIHEVEAA